MQIGIANRLLQDFFKELAIASHRLLILDYDGTIAPFNKDRDRAYPYDGVISRLVEIRDTPGTSIVLITGRSLASILSLIDLDLFESTWGTHGWERSDRKNGQVLFEISREHKSALDRIEDLGKAAGVGSRIERKPASVAIHFRGIDPVSSRDEMRSLRDDMIPLAESSGLSVTRFDGGYEFIVPGRNKGTTVSSLVRSVDEETAIACLGDDQSDEDSFLALGKQGLKILVRPQSRSTSADVWLSPPEELLDFFDGWLNACSG